MINSCWLAGLGGKWPAVLRLTGEWLSGMRLAGRYQIATARALRSQACLAFGNPDDAREELERALPDLEQMAPVASLSLAEVMVRRGDTADAMAIVSRFVEDLGDGTPSTTTAGMLGLVSADLDMPETWALCYEWLKDEPSSLLAVYRPCSLDRIRGRLATRLGRWTEGIQHFNTAIDALRVSGAAWELTQAYCDYAELRRKRGRKGDTRRAAALQAEAEAIAKSLKLDLPSTPRSAVSRMRHGLSEREADVLMLVAQGHRNNEIAESLTISIRTVERHLENIFAKMGVRNRTEAVIEAARTGLLGEVA
jgi:ATP/maltotriose-dependent transcriptional regulator MalT